MSYTAFIAAVLVLLVTPGPTNTLMGIAGSTGGWGRVARLLPAELLGYLTTIIPLVYLGSPILEQWPMAAAVLKVAAAGWILYLAYGLWGIRGGDDAPAEVTARKILVTTMLNPKALIFGLVLLPAPDGARFALNLGSFCVMVVGAAFLWGTIGFVAQIGGDGTQRLQVIRRTGSVWLAVVSVLLVASLIRT